LKNASKGTCLDPLIQPVLVKNLFPYVILYR
jgi:hypothetical protein